MILPKAKPAGATKSGRSEERPFPRVFRGSMASPALDSGLLASRTTRGYISTYLSHPTCGALLEQPWEMRPSAPTIPPSIPSLPVDPSLTIAALLGHHHHVRLLECQLVILSGFVGSKALHLWGVLEEKSVRGVRKGRS